MATITPRSNLVPGKGIDPTTYQNWLNSPLNKSGQAPTPLPVFNPAGLSDVLKGVSQNFLSGGGFFNMGAPGSMGGTGGRDQHGNLLDNNLGTVVDPKSGYQFGSPQWIAWAKVNDPSALQPGKIQPALVPSSGMTTPSGPIQPMVNTSGFGTTVPPSGTSPTTSSGMPTLTTYPASTGYRPLPSYATYNPSFPTIAGNRAAAQGVPAAGTPDASLTGQALNQNLATAPNLDTLSQLINQINLNAQQQANQGRIPGEAGLEQTSSGNIGQALQGQLPQDVVSLISQQAAERGLASGSPGSPNADASLLRSLGLTSLGLMGQGQNWLNAATGRNPVAPIFNPATQLITPYQLGQLNVDMMRGNQGGIIPNVFRTGQGGQAPTIPPEPTATPSTDWFSSLFGQNPYSFSPYAPASGSYGSSGSYNDYTGQNDMNYLLGDTNVNPYTGTNDSSYFADYGGSDGFGFF